MGSADPPQKKKKLELRSEIAYGAYVGQVSK